MAEQTERSPLRILLVEDNEHDVRAIDHVLGKGDLAATITHFERAEEAMARLAEDETAFDIVLTDYKLPGISGLELCETLLADRIEVPLVILTGTGSEQVAVEALKAGVSDYVVKDPNGGYLELLPAVLTAAVRKHADRVARKRAEEALRRSEKNLAQAQSLARMGSFEINFRTGESLGSDEVHRILGIGKDKFRPDFQVWIDTVHAEDREAVQAAVLAAQDPDIEQDWYRIEYKIVRPDGTMRTLEERGEVTFDSDRRPLRMRGVFQDITERKKLEEQLAEVRKTEAVGRLTGGVAHEFNNLLTIVIGNLDLIEDCLPADERPHALLEKARAGALYGAQLTERLLAYSRKQMLQPRIIDLNDLVLRLRDVIRGTLGETLALETDLAEALWAVHVDPGQIEIAILNLVLNARDAAPPDNVITIGTLNTTLETASAPVHPEGVAGDYVVLSVTDRGCGMTTEVSRRAFEPFFTTKDVNQGTGLGLSMVYGFVRQSDGFAEIDSEPGEGTTVTLYLPRAQVGAGTESS